MQKFNKWLWVKLDIGNKNTLVVGFTHSRPNNGKCLVKHFEDDFVRVNKTYKTNQQMLAMGDLNVKHTNCSKSTAITITTLFISMMLDAPK